MKIILAILLLGYMIFGAATEEGQPKDSRRTYIITNAGGTIVKDTLANQIMYLDSRGYAIEK